MRIAVLVPSRGRPDRAALMARSVIETSGGRVAVVLIVDPDDPELEAYRARIPDGASLVVLPERVGYTASLNAVAGDMWDDFDVLGAFGDDVLFRSFGWDLVLEETLSTPGLAYGDDLIHGEKHPSAVFMSSAIAKALGWLALPVTTHQWADDGWKRLGQELGVLRYMSDVVVEHLHPAVHKAEWDATYESVFESDRAKRDYEGFTAWAEGEGLPADVAKVRTALRGAGPRIVFLVPRRDDHGPRDRIWEYCKARWRSLFPGIDVVEGHHDEGLFSRSAAVNRAAAAAGDWDLAIVIDSDVLLSRSSVQAAIERATQTGRVTWAHRRWRGIREDMTERIVADRRDLGVELDRDDLDLMVERTNPLSWSCCIVVPRGTWDDLGGFDERFEGWGFEDMAFQSVICGLYGWERIEGDVVHLWHPRSEDRITPGQPRLTATPEYVTNARLGRRYMVALRRDHALHDRGDMPASDDERQRDIRNLVGDDAKYAPVVARLGLPDWSDWWPTLEELRDGAKVHRLGPVVTPTVTVVVRTGGEPETWAERSDYLRRSLASLVENVSGPIVQRVVYSDWGPDRLLELQAIANEHGFYVVGPARHVGYVAAMRHLWAYIEGKARGEYVFSTEDDFVYDQPVDLEPMIATLRDNRDLRQMALLRGPYYAREIEAGGVLESLQTPVELRNHRPHPFIEHRDHFTANPSLFHRSLVREPWPTGSNTERRFGDAVLRDKRARFAYWGAGEPWVTHIGAVRAAAAY